MMEQPPAPKHTCSPTEELLQLRAEAAAAPCPKKLLREFRTLLQKAGLKIYKSYAEAGIHPVRSVDDPALVEKKRAVDTGARAEAGSEVDGKASPLAETVVGPDDLLFIIDMQFDFLPPYGTFGVPEGNSATHAILTKYMLKDFLNNPVYLSRDYHPVDHCSFVAQNGPFPSHCVQGTKGAHFDESIGRAISARRHLRHEQKVSRICELDKLEAMFGSTVFKHSESRKYQSYLSTGSSASASTASDDQGELIDEVHPPPPLDPKGCDTAAIREHLLLTPAVGETKVVFKGFSPDIDSFGAAPYALEDHQASANTRLSLRPADVIMSTGCEHLGEVPEGMTAMHREDTIFATVETHITPITRSPAGEWPASPVEEDASCDSPRHVPTRKNFCSPAWTGSFILRSSNEPQDVNAPPDVLSVMNRREVLKDVENLFHRRWRDRNIVHRVLRPNAPRTTRLPNAFICGLALDFCVVDTAINIARHCSEFFENVCILLDGCRASHVPGLGHYGSGFLTNPAEFAEWVTKAGVKIIDLSMDDEDEEANEPYHS